ncbi:MAG: hypothetical protein MZU84_03715 [Sphingobacterium sp.]|nr:hypothetical protein [Sphingobacterium sp.]
MSLARCVMTATAVPMTKINDIRTLSILTIVGVIILLTLVSFLTSQEAQNNLLSKVITKIEIFNHISAGSYMDYKRCESMPITRKKTNIEKVLSYNLITMRVRKEN